MFENNNWIGVDWGGSRLRVWYFDQGEIIDFRASNAGIKTLSSSKDFALAFAKLTKGWELNQVPVIACGMVGSRDGWQEVPYVNMTRSTPFDITNLANYLYVLAPAKKRELDKILHQVNKKNLTIGKIFLIPGIAQKVKREPQVMRGEETQLLGLEVLKKTGSYLRGSMQPKGLSTNFMELAILPGTHSKWVWLKEGGQKISYVQTFMSGELFDVLTNHSLLKYCTTLPNRSLTRGISLHSLTVENFFLEGLMMVKNRSMEENLFHIRSYDLLYGHNPVCAHYRLSGVIIGSEVKNGLRDFKLVGAKSVRKPKIYLLGNDNLNIWYQEALRFFGYPKSRIEQISSDEASKAGLTEIFLQLKKSTIAL